MVYSVYLINLNLQVILVIPKVRYTRTVRLSIGNSMKTLKISDDIHQKLTSLLGELTAQTSKMQTYQDAINALLQQSVIMPPELLIQVQNFIEENKHLGYTTKEEFIREAVRFKLKMSSEEYEYVEIPKEQYDLLDEAVKEMNVPYSTAEDFIHTQIREALEKYQEWKKTVRKQK